MNNILISTIDAVLTVLTVICFIPQSRLKSDFARKLVR